MKLIVGVDEAAAYRDICLEINVTPDARVGTKKLNSLLLIGESREIPIGCLDLRGKYNMATLPLAEWASFKAQILPSPFRDVVVAQVVMTSSLGSDTKTARGTGATSSLESSLERAFSECLQMYYSLSSTLGDAPDTLDMRALWADGSARHTFPNLFEPCEGTLTPIKNSVDPQCVLDNIITSAREQGLKVYCYELASSPNFSIAKTFMSRLAVTDAMHFRTNRRFEQFGALVGAPYRDIHFRGPLFM